MARACIEWCYHDGNNIEPQFRELLGGELFVVASALLMGERLLALCEAVLVDLIDLGSWSSLFTAAWMHNATRLRLKCVEVAS